MKQQKTPMSVGQMHSTIDYEALIKMQSSSQVNRVSKEKEKVKVKTSTAPKCHRRVGS